MGRRKKVARFVLTTGLSLEGELVRRGAREYTLIHAKTEVPAVPGAPSEWADLTGEQKIPRTSVAYYTLMLA